MLFKFLLVYDSYINLPQCSKEDWNKGTGLKYFTHKQLCPDNKVKETCLQKLFIRDCSYHRDTCSVSQKPKPS